MSVPIQNGKNTNLTQNSGTTPNVNSAIQDWFQKMTFTTIVKTIVNFQLVEQLTNVDFLGVWQPFTTRDLLMKPEGQRRWSWFMVHSDINLELTPDEIIAYQGQNYRVMQANDYKIYGYMEYHIIQDYQE